jgi:hypothetical protein
MKLTRILFRAAGLTPLLVSMLSAELLLNSSAYAANVANDSGSNYTNPWGPPNPQNNSSGFAPWYFYMTNPTAFTPNFNPFFIDTNRGAFGINVTDDNSYDVAWLLFTGDGQIDVGQIYTTDLLFTPPGTYSTTQTPTEGICLIAQSPTVPPSWRYQNFGHQVLGLYVGPTSPGVYQIGLAIHNTLSDENPNQWIWLPWKFTGTAKKPMSVHFVFQQLAAGAWTLKLSSPGKNALVYGSAQQGLLWNTSTGVSAVQYFTSQGNTNPGGMLEWTNMTVR